MYEKEMDFLKTELKIAFDTYGSSDFEVEEKEAFDVVTDVDKNIEDYLQKRIRRVFPGDGIHSEETASQAPLAGRTWILDPIDGTWNFSAGSCHFGLQCALWDGERVAVCAIYLPKLGEFYHAAAGQGAYCNGQRLAVRRREAKNAIIAFGDLPHTRERDAEAQKQMMIDWFPKTARYRMFGAACVDYTSLASSRVDAVILFTPNKWDLACGWLLCAEAGALVLGDGGRPYDFSSRSIQIYSSHALYEELNQKGETA